jgi:nicotinate-nucleotide pyrophosphorylase (carboxylating)
MTPATRRALTDAGLDPEAVQRIVETALTEDVGTGDVTSVATIPADQNDVADLVARADGVVAGLPVAAAVFDAAVHHGPGAGGVWTEERSDEGRRRLKGPGARASGGERQKLSPGAVGSSKAGVGVVGTLAFDQKVSDGARVARGDVLATVAGPTRTLLMAERTALNLLCRMSGIATHTRAWADALAGTKAQVLDTRKTTPGLRVLEKYAVRAGGGTNKRMGLYDVAMIKDNHKIAAGGLTAAFARVRSAFPDIPVQVEVTTVAEAVEAVGAGADFLLCDNMSPALLREVVAAVGDRAQLEATGGLTLGRVREYADTGVDYLSVGALTHSSPILDIALDLRAG